MALPAKTLRRQRGEDTGDSCAARRATKTEMTLTMNMHTHRARNFKPAPLALAAALLACLAGTAGAVELGGFEFNGYSRGGPVLSHSDDVKGNLSLGGELQKYRLGNEGDNGIEINLARTFDLNGTKFKVAYMPAKWNSGSVSTEQAYVEVSGLDFSPEAKFWVGQRRLRIQDVHIVDNFLLNYGDYQGAGVTNVPVGGMRLGVGVFTGDRFDNPLPAGVKANRVNLDLSEIATNAGGKLRLLATAVHGSGLANSNTGAGLSALHNQADFVMKGMTNSLYLQASRGHARIDGEFEAIDGTTPGRRVARIADSIQWQSGPLGGQALVGWQTSRDDATHVTTKDASLGGRVSYAFTRNFKLLGEASTTSRKVAGTANQRLNKFTIAPTLSVGEGFYDRPELRLFYTHGSWNSAAAAANAATFGKGGKTSRNIAGLQYEIWW
jgi:maltoporin